MKEIAIVTDSTAYIPEPESIRQGISVVPLTVNFEDGFIVDGIQDNESFFTRVDKASNIPFTSQPAVGQFEEVYKSLLDQGKEIISIHLSSKLSGTMESASLAAKALNAQGDISVVDSFSASGGLAFLVRAAIDWAEKRVPRQEIVQRLEKQRGNIRLMFVPDTLEYLKKGGRIGRAQALVGTLLQLKPILYVDQGEIAVLDKVRTKKRALQRMLEEIPKGKEKVKITVLHAVALAEAQELYKEVLHKVPNAIVNIDELGPVLSIHTGPKVIGLTIWSHD